MNWEYKTLRLRPSRALESVFEFPELDAFINQYGAIGWELIATQGIIDWSPMGPHTKEFLIFLKRPLAD